MQLTQVVGSNILPMARMQNFSHHLSRIRKSWSAPTISIYEVFKRVFQQRGEGDALQAIAVMAQGKTVELSLEVAVSAAKISAELKLPMTDSVILATSRASGATLWTEDADFEGVPGYLLKKAGTQRAAEESQRATEIFRGFLWHFTPEY